MSKAEDLALEKYPPRSVLVVPARGGGYYADSHLREGFIDGYHQAEEDNELTWEDMECVIKHYQDIMAEKSRVFVCAEDYKEVLKRYKKEREITMATIFKKVFVALATQ